MTEHPRLLTEKQAADYLKMSPKTLQRRRFDKRPPTYLSLSGTIRYRISDLDRYLEGSIVLPKEACNA